MLGHIESIKTNHIQDGQFPIYCHKLKLVKPYLSQRHMDEQCLAGCPYFAGGYQGNGIECLYYDGTNESVDLKATADVLKERMEALEKIVP